VTTKIKALKILINALASLGLLVILVTVLPLDGFFLKLFCNNCWNSQRGEVLIVLGADSLPDMIGLSSYWRSVYAVRVWREGGFNRIVLSGGKNAEGAVIGDQMKQFLVSQGVPPDRIVVEQDSHSTHENALFTARLLAGVPGRKVLLTSDYHTFRASRAFRKAGLEVLPRPIPDAAKLVNNWRFRWTLFLNLAIEGSKTGYYYVRGWI
jgi:uncharacterized SAM-binding protein YcdF (DUF218 family)